MTRKEDAVFVNMPLGQNEAFIHLEVDGRKYPENGGVSVDVEIQTFEDGVFEIKRNLLKVVEGIIHKRKGGECCMEIIQEAMALWGHNTKDALPEGRDEVKLDRTSREEIGCNQGSSLGRMIIFFHHIINQNKRKAIIEYAKELSLGGYCKIGWP